MAGPVLHYVRVLSRLSTFRYRSVLRAAWGAREWRACLQSLFDEDEPALRTGLELRLSQALGAPYVRTTDSGRSAILLALEALRLPASAEVILPSFSCSGVLMPVLEAGLTPVLADVDGSFNLSADSVEEALGPETGAVILPHLSGRFAAGTNQILELCREQGVPVIEDACQALGLVVEGVPAGSRGCLGVHSFGVGKLLNLPGGGAVASECPDLACFLSSRALEDEPRFEARARTLRFVWSYVLDRLSFPFEFFRATLGGVSRHGGAGETPVGMSDVRPRTMQAGDCRLATIALDGLKPRLAGLRANGLALLRALDSARDWLILPDPEDHIFTKFLVSCRTGDPGGQALRVRRALLARGFETESAYTPLHLRTSFRSYRQTSLANTAALAPGAFYLPHTPFTRPDEVASIARIVLEAAP